MVGGDSGRQKTRNHGYDVIVGGEAILLVLRSPSQTCHAKPKNSNQQAPDAITSFPLVGCLPQEAAWPERLLSEKSGLLALQQMRGALPMIDRGDIRQAIDRCSNILGFTAGRWLWSKFEHKADSLIAKFKSGRNGQRLM